MKFDEILEKLGAFGTYQKRVFGLLTLPSISIGSFCYIVIVLMYTPAHRCKIPGLHNDTFEVQDSFHSLLINQSIPRSNDSTLIYDRCHVYESVSTEYDSYNRPVNASISKCKQWVYDESVFYSTFTSKADFVCSDALKTSHVQMFFYFGVLVGDFVFGMFADALGRKKSLCAALTLLLAISVALTWAPEFYTFSILLFIVGGCAHGAFMCFAVISMELVGPTKRVWTGMILQICFAIGCIYLAGISYLIRAWNWINLACALPCIFYLSFWWLIPESPRWLISKGRKRESVDIIRRAADTNKVVVPDSMLDVQADKTATQGNLLHVIKSPVLLRRTLVLCFNWCIVSMTYYGVTMNAGNLGGSFYLNFLLMGVAELPGYFIGISLLDRIGRRLTNAGGLIVGGLACLATVPTVLLASSDFQPLIIALALIGKAGSSMAFGVIFIFTAELLPTIVRNAVMGSCSSAARIGAMLAPYIAKSGELIGGDFGKVEPLVIFGSLSIIAGLLLLLLPETLNHKLPDTIKEGEVFGRKQRSQTIADVEVRSPFIENN